jgi:hypothetical protein
MINTERMFITAGEHPAPIFVVVTGAIAQTQAEPPSLWHYSAWSTNMQLAHKDCRGLIVTVPPLKTSCVSNDGTFEVSFGLVHVIHGFGLMKHGNYTFQFTHGVLDDGNGNGAIF